MGVSAGEGMIHYVLLTRDDVGRSVIDSRVIDVDPHDGLEAAGRVNAGIDLMLTAARDADIRVGPIGVAARTDKQRRELGSRGAGPRRQILLVGEDEAVVEYLVASGQISRFDSVVVVDCGDTGMSLFTVDPSTKEITAPHRSRALSGQALDRAIVDALLEDSGAGLGRARRRSLVSACRTAKEDVTAGVSSLDNSPVVLSGDPGNLALTAEVIDSAVAPMVDEARKVLARYLADRPNPGAVALVGGLANLPAVQRIVEDDSIETVVSPNPELTGAVGAALLARTRTTSETSARLAFIGGRPQRGWLSVMPLAVVAVILAATLMTVYAVSSALTGHSSPAPSTQTRPVSSPVADSTTAATQWTNEAPSTRPSRTTAVPQVPQVPVDPGATETVEPTGPARPTPQPRWDGGPGWATTELPATPESPTTSTRTLSPFPLPSLPWPRGTTPTIPPEFLPPGVRPPESAPSAPRGAPNRQPTPTAPTTTTPTADAAG